MRGGAYCEQVLIERDQSSEVGEQGPNLLLVEQCFLTYRLKEHLLLKIYIN